MPIKPEDRLRYPPDWKEIRDAVLERAHHRCEWCGVENHDVGYRSVDGSFIEESYFEMLDSITHNYYFRETTPKKIRIVLTIAHLDHTPENCAPENLAALCQKCHLNYDQQYHALRRQAARSEKLRVAIPGGWVQTDLPIEDASEGSAVDAIRLLSDTAYQAGSALSDMADALPPYAHGIAEKTGE